MHATPAGRPERRESLIEGPTGRRRQGPAGAAEVEPGFTFALQASMTRPRCPPALWGGWWDPGAGIGLRGTDSMGRGVDTSRGTAASLSSRRVKRTGRIPTRDWCWRSDHDLPHPFSK